MDTHAYNEAYEVALQTLTDIMRESAAYSAEDRIDAAATVLINRPPESKKDKEESTK